jgi:hypothetical protein
LGQRGQGPSGVQKALDEVWEDFFPNISNVSAVIIDVEKLNLAVAGKKAET